MERYEEEGEDSDNETDPEQLLNEWLGELDSLTVVSLKYTLSFDLSVRKVNPVWKKHTEQECKKKQSGTRIFNNYAPSTLKFIGFVIIYDLYGKYKCE